MRAGANSAPVTSPRKGNRMTENGRRIRRRGVRLRRWARRSRPYVPFASAMISLVTEAIRYWAEPR
jgi:hypothetical protein